MEPFIINKKVFNTPFHICCTKDGTIKREYHNNDTIIDVNSEEGKVLSKLYGFELPHFPPNKYQKFFHTIKNAEPNKIPWEHVLPETIYKKEVKNYITQIKEIYKNLDLSYYRKVLQQSATLFEDLKAAKIDTNALLRLLSSSSSKDAHLKSFLPQHQNDGYSPMPFYSRGSSKTGRLTVIKGANILNLKRENRIILTSRFGKNGSIHSLDYASIEPRVLLTILGKEDLPQDVYQYMLDETGLGKNISREAIKQVVVSRIYGASIATITKQLKDLIEYHPEDIIKIIDDYFGIEGLRETLSLELIKNEGKMIKSFYGRPILCEGSPFYTLLNNFVQSTAVDAAIFGFNQVNNKLKEAGISDNIVPIFILHDELFLDVHNDFIYLLPKLCKVGSFDIPKFENTNFWLKRKE